MRNRVLEITYDLQAKAGYVYFSGRSVARTVECADSIYLDLDRRGQLIGIELLQISNRQPAWQLHFRLNRLTREYRMPELSRLHPEKLAEILQPA